MPLTAVNGRSLKYFNRKARGRRPRPPLDKSRATFVRRKGPRVNVHLLLYVSSPRSNHPINYPIYGKSNRFNQQEPRHGLLVRDPAAAEGQQHPERLSRHRQAARFRPQVHQHHLAPQRSHRGARHGRHGAHRQPAQTPRISRHRLGHTEPLRHRSRATPRLQGIHQG